MCRKNILFENLYVSKVHDKKNMHKQIFTETEFEEAEVDVIGVVVVFTVSGVRRFWNNCNSIIHMLGIAHKKKQITSGETLAIAKNNTSTSIVIETVTIFSAISRHSLGWPPDLKWQPRYGHKFGALKPVYGQQRGCLQILQN